jgi:hypothetical protein
VPSLAVVLADWTGLIEVVAASTAWDVVIAAALLITV